MTNTIKNDNIKSIKQKEGETLMDFLNDIRNECNKYKNTLDNSKIVMHNVSNKISFNKGN